MRTILMLFAVVAFLQQAPRYAPVQDGDAHGDPPYLLEEGWVPLLNGKDLTGWKACEAGAKNEWDTTRYPRGSEAPPPQDVRRAAAGLQTGPAVRR